MKKLIISALICAFCTSAVIAQDSVRVRPSKVTFNNMLVMATLDAKLTTSSSFPFGFLPLYISDLSFDDFDREVVIEKVAYKNEFGEMVRCNDSDRYIALRYDSAQDEYRIMFGGGNEGTALAVNPSNQKRINQYCYCNMIPQSKPTRQEGFQCAYVFPEQSGKIIKYDGYGQYSYAYNVELDDKGRVSKFFSQTFSYDDKNNIVKVVSETKNSEYVEIEKTGADTWLLRRASSGVSAKREAKITVLERNEKGLWTRITVEYMKDFTRNLNPVKFEMIRYFDSE